jgi:drug/metabolite transporter (DMT)-like permease
MQRTHRLRSAGLAGLVLGIAGMVLGATGGELGQLGIGYGLLLVVAAGYLLAGLAIRDAVQSRRARASDSGLSGAPAPAPVRR